MANRSTRPWSEIALDGHQADVLRELVRQHIRTGEPVGSVSVGRSAKLALSPASIRSVMAELETAGLLTQPHKSAGRVPTDRGYRVYVDQLAHRARVSAEHAQAIEDALSENGNRIEALLGQASRQLSLFSDQVGLVLAPAPQRLIVDQIEFTRLDSTRVIAVLVARSGVVQNRIIPIDESLEPAELARISRYLSSELGGRTLPEMRQLLEQRRGREQALYDRLVARSLELARKAVETDENENEAELFVDGASNLLTKQDFSDLGLLQSLLRTLEDKRTLIELLGRLIESRGVQVVIGEENPLSDLNRCALVASTYRAGDRVMGTVGVVGPIRMPYGKTMALVDHLSAYLTRFLSETEN
jgi:heat-inducible transcriptional repressor